MAISLNIIILRSHSSDENLTLTMLLRKQKLSAHPSLKAGTGSVAHFLPRCMVAFIKLNVPVLTAHFSLDISVPVPASLPVKTEHPSLAHALSLQSAGHPLPPCANQVVTYLFCPWGLILCVLLYSFKFHQKSYTPVLKFYF